ncbi:ERBB receptor feedback inhibitor 1 [Huso huso]|uniref:ERBB receptor feedback inhibitor 1 n=1 Tax=Huso huso TaxID=61971 RepID=A0ABR0YYR0_HUSHU
MSTAGLTAPEISVPLKSGFLHGTHCHSMGSAKTCWEQHSGLQNLYFSLDPGSMGYLKQHQQVPASLGFERQAPHTESLHSHCCSGSGVRLPPKKSRPARLNLSSVMEPSFHSSSEEDQVVPSFKRLSVNGGSFYERTPPHTPLRSGERGAKPLPPLPGPGTSGELSPDEVDSEVEFFTSSDNISLVQDKPASFRSSAPSRRSFRGCGQVNLAYFEDCAVPASSCQLQHAEEKRAVPEESPCHRQHERPHRRLRRSHSGPAGSFNKPVLRLSCHRTSQRDSDDKPVVPPRVPIPPRPVKADYRRWSAEVTSSSAYSDEDKPPKVPPREPMSRSGSRTPSPKSLPTYTNGVMPTTQSFAPNPKYVSAKALHRQNSEGSPTRSPCILPIMENGRKASTTHYYLLPERPAYLDKFEKFFSETASTSSSSCTASTTPLLEFSGVAENSDLGQPWSSGGCPLPIPQGSNRLADSRAKPDMVNHVQQKNLLDVVSL